MLMITRKLNESILIEGKDSNLIKIKVTQIKKNPDQAGTVRIGIEAPLTTKILRSELLKQKMKAS